MSTKEPPIVGREDVVRMTKEIEAQFEDDSPDSEVWAAKNNIDWEAFRGVINAAINAVADAMIEEGKKMLESEDIETETTEIAPGVFVQVQQAEFGDLSSLIGNSCAHCFILGWEMGREYGRR